jgi:hypothetical protein
MTPVREVLETALARGVAAIKLDAKLAGVVVPEPLRHQDLVLNLSWNFAGRDLVVNDWGVRQTLTFGTAGSFACAIPWNAIWCVKGQGIFELITEAMPRGEILRYVLENLSLRGLTERMVTMIDGQEQEPGRWAAWRKDAGDALNGVLSFVDPAVNSPEATPGPVAPARGGLTIVAGGKP